MSTRTTLRPYPVITAGNMAVNITSSPTVLNGLTKAAYQASWSGSTPVGTLSVQGSNDYALSSDGQTVANAGHWVTLTLNVDGTPSTTVSVSGNTGSDLINMSELAFFAIRLIYTAGSGTGTMNATICGKVS